MAYRRRQHLLRGGCFIPPSTPPPLLSIRRNKNQTSMGWLLARASRLMALAYSRDRKLVHISYSGWVWSTHRYSIQVVNPSLSQRWVHHSIVT